MSFVLRNAAETFQLFIDEVTHQLRFCFAYLNDILIVNSFHRRHMQTTFRSRHSNQYKKLQVGVSQRNFLGHHADLNAIRTLLEKVGAVATFPRRRESVLFPAFSVSFTTTDASFSNVRCFYILWSNSSPSSSRRKRLCPDHLSSWCLSSGLRKNLLRLHYCFIRLQMRRRA